jgi:hypothetical protein
VPYVTCKEKEEEEVTSRCVLIIFNPQVDLEVVRLPASSMGKEDEEEEGRTLTTGLSTFPPPRPLRWQPVHPPWPWPLKERIIYM